MTLTANPVTEPVAAPPAPAPERAGRARRVVPLLRSAGSTVVITVTVLFLASLVTFALAYSVLDLASYLKDITGGDNGKFVFVDTTIGDSVISGS